ncbi:MAG: SDR family NAD(P)-dependent oxidoreductase, partial [Planctomycetota bacterium]|nr:SDR family NAD(P)-dependent oxidoreductase [Planctomycetota bacterium]
MTNSIQGKTMLITGASSGIGKATAIACAQAGMNVVLTARRRKQLEALQEEIGGTTKIIVGDVTENG